MSQRGITEIGKYRIVGQIGEGAMGVVYRAQDPVLNRPVAIKVMSDALARDDDLRNRFLREAQAAGSLQHPNVITIYDFGEVDGHPYIAMEFVAGEDLEEILAKQVQLTAQQKIEILIDVLGGLAYAHKRGIVHRDIKPANIRIDEDGRARIMDFGIAHLSSSKMTKTGIMVGTPAYMAPEQIVGGVISQATDLFSVGAVMYELFTGTKPFAAESLQSVFYKIVSAPAPSLLEAVPDLPAALNQVLQKALAKEPADRYATALEMANALTAVRATLDTAVRTSTSVSLRSVIDTGLAARPTVRTPVSTGPDRKRTLAIAGGAAAVAVVLVGVLVLRPRDKAAPSPGVPAVQPTAASPSSPASSGTASPSPAPAASPVSAVAQTPQPAPPGSAVTPAGAVTAAAPKGSAKPTGKNDAASSARELEAFRTMQTTASDARRRAVDAGATAEQLKEGDDHNKRATALANEGKLMDGVTHLNQATTAWFGAERDARAAAAAASAAKTRVADAPKQEVTVQQPPPPAAVVKAPDPAPAPVNRAPPPNPNATAPGEIAAVVAAYARAIDSRDINEVRRAYPGATSAQATGFEQFFSSVRSLHATFTVNNLDVGNGVAEARIIGTYDYVTKDGKSDRTALDFQANFRRENGAWKLIAVRTNH